MKPVVTVWKVTSLVLAFALLGAGAAWAQSDSQQSLGDIARKQRAKKGQTEEKAPKVLTNDDLPHSGGLSTASSPSGSAPSSTGATAEAPGNAAAAGTEKEAAAAGQDSGKNAAEELDAVKKKLEGLKHDEQAYKTGTAHFEDLIANESSESRRELYRRALQHGQEKLAENLKEQAETEKELAAKEAAAKAEQQSQPQPAPAPAPAEQPPQ